MDIIKRKLSVKKPKQVEGHGLPEELSTPETTVEMIDDSLYLRSEDGTYTTTRPRAHSKSKRQQPVRSPGSFVKYGGPGLNAPGNVKNDPTSDAFGFTAIDVPPLPQNAHVHGDDTISDLERYRLQTLSKDPVHEGFAAEGSEMLARKGLRVD